MSQNKLFAVDCTDSRLQQIPIEMVEPLLAMGVSIYVQSTLGFTQYAVIFDQALRYIENENVRYYRLWATDDD